VFSSLRINSCRIEMRLVPPMVDTDHPDCRYPPRVVGIYADADVMAGTSSKIYPEKDTKLKERKKGFTTTTKTRIR
jgi:hypothetical protein